MIARLLLWLLFLACGAQAGEDARSLLTGPLLTANPLALAWNTSNSPNAATNVTGAAMSLTAHSIRKSCPSCSASGRTRRSSASP